MARRDGGGPWELALESGGARVAHPGAVVSASGLAAGVRGGTGWAEGRGPLSRGCGWVPRSLWWTVSQIVLGENRSRCGKARCQPARSAGRFGARAQRRPRGRSRWSSQLSGDGRVWGGSLISAGALLSCSNGRLRRGLAFKFKSPN